MGSSPIGPATKPTFYVFTYRGNPVKGFRTSFENACKKAGIKDVSFHTLRHTFATRLVLEGVDIDSVRKLMGHSSITMTMRYSHPTPEALKSAVETLDSLNSEKSVSSFVSSIIDENGVTSDT
ncbi:MAG: tyrosine-type recombinase/integrase [Ignavibacteriales bacterium]